jgi:hypothetical protein
MKVNIKHASRRVFIKGFVSGMFALGAGLSLKRLIEEADGQYKKCNVASSYRVNQSSLYEIFIKTVLSPHFPLFSESLQLLSTRSVSTPNNTQISRAVEIFEKNIFDLYIAQLDYDRCLAGFNDFVYIIIALLERKEEGIVIQSAMDRIYDDLSWKIEDHGFILGRRSSVPGHRCAYWDSYDQPPNSA